MDLRNPQKPRFDWAGITISAAFDGVGIAFLLEDDGNSYNILIDGKLERMLHPRPGLQNHTVDGLTDTRHNITITKRTSPEFGCGCFHGFMLDENKQLHPAPSKPKRKIEFIGDSFTVGYGVEGTPQSAGLQQYENSYLAYASLTARALGAKEHLIALSGYGLVRNWDSPRQTSPDPLPFYYGRAVKNDPAAPWDFVGWTPDAAVINLGTNDFALPPGANPENYIKEYLGFIARLRGYHPGLPVFCMAQQPFLRHVTTIVARANAAGDRGVFLVEYFHNGKENGFGCANHPNLKSQREIAAPLIQIMREKLGWQAY